MVTFAQYDDIEKIMDFIDREWRKGHILARDRKFFEYMYMPDDKVNFVLSKNNDGEIDGILGYIPYDKECSQAALTVWKALKSSSGMIGMSMLGFLEKELKLRIIASPGINPVTTTAIYKYCKYEVGKMNHFYRLAERNNYNIAVVSQSSRKRSVEADTTIKSIETYEQFCDVNIKFNANALQKDNWYIKHRYFEHPVFKYQFFLLEQKTKESLIVVVREQSVGEDKCLRIVDLLGNYELISGFASRVDYILQEGNYEYIDCYIAGVDKDIFINSGWNNIEDTEDIIPNYFSPFEQKNVDLFFSCKPKGVVILRGDGDQDRPN